MYTALQHAHSGLRWIVLLLLLVSVIQNLLSWKSGAQWTSGSQKRNLITLATFHLQVVLGLVLYAISPAVSFGEGLMQNAISRFYTIEHITLMLLAAVILTVGYSRIKKQQVSSRKYRTGFYIFLATLLIVLAAIPWPFRNLGGGWF